MYGLLNLPWWGVVLTTLGLTHVTIVGVTLFLHRCQAHRALDMGKGLSHFFRFWLWMTTGMVTKEWVAVHRKHHARCDTAEDPHSPQTRGIATVMTQGALLYTREAASAQTLERFGKGTPDDWMERKVYTAHSRAGIAAMLLIDLLLFGVPGIAVWITQMLWIPFWAAGVVNGVGHWWGSRNFDTEDASRNISPWGIIIGGEELHNNHHCYPSSAKLSVRKHEFDIGWMYLSVFARLGWVHIKKVPPRMRERTQPAETTLETLDTVVAHRFELMATYATALRKLYRREKRAQPEGLPVVRRSVWKRLEVLKFHPKEESRLAEIRAKSTRLARALELRAELAKVWTAEKATREESLQRLRTWLHEVEKSGIAELAALTRRVRHTA
ncbi:acyl-CoA desaturase [Paraburkholderia sp. UCT31]|uniref:DesA family fatty acid desaturase n=1 Tax=Paraburkholderia sp. UCT31 TaxID=2615209 RepID=UPI0016552623|nr:fatty acid desaturase [Paraburkholderia sp. UCT31]MBC8737376.1 acyl-CoA desaturase [Paraburkholderia sp. UCT31]